MSEMYYEKEDVLPETPAQAIENFQAQSNSLAHVVPDVAVALQQAGEALGQLYEQAQAAGNTGAMALISASWERMEFTAHQTVQLDALKQSAAAAIATIDEDRQAVIKTLDDLEAALAHGDEGHPMLKEYALEIRQDEADAAAEEIESEAYEWAGEVAYDHYMETIKMITGCHWKKISRFLGILNGDYSVSDLQADELRLFIEELDIERDGAE